MFAKIDSSLISGETNILELDVDSLTILKIIMEMTANSDAKNMHILINIW